MSDDDFLDAKSLDKNPAGMDSAEEEQASGVPAEPEPPIKDAVGQLFGNSMSAGSSVESRLSPSTPE